MNLKRPVLAALVAAILFATWLIDRRVSVEKTADTIIRLSQITFVEATSVSLSNKAGEFELERRADGWWITKPRELRADEGQVRALIDNLHGTKVFGAFESDDIAAYGLKEPAATMRVRGKLDGKNIESVIMLGDNTPQPGRIYARLGDRPEIFSIGDWVRNQASRDVDLLRSKQLLFMDEAPNPHKMTVQTPVGGRELEKREGTWHVAESGTPADDLLVRQVLSEMGAARAMKIIDEPTTSTMELGFEPPRLRVAIESEKGDKWLELGKIQEDGETVVARTSDQPGVSLVRVASVRSAMRPPSAWGTRNLVWWSPDDFIRIDTRTAKTTMTLVRDADDKWIFEESPETLIHQARLARFIEAISTVSGNRLADEDVSTPEKQKEFGILEESFTLEVTNREGKKQGIRLGGIKPSERIAHVLRIQDNTVWEVEVGLIEGLHQLRPDLMDKRFLGTIADKASRIQLKAKQIVIVIEKKNDVWQRTQEGKPAVTLNELHVTDLLKTIEDLEWQSQIPDAEASTGLPVNLTISVYDGAGSELCTFDIMEEPGTDKLVKTRAGMFAIRPSGFTNLDAALQRVIIAQ